MNFKLLENIVSVVLFAVFVTGVAYTIHVLKNKTSNKVVAIPTNQKVVSVSFHEGHLFYLTRGMTECDSAITYQLIKFDQYQEIEEVIKIVETKH